MMIAKLTRVYSDRGFESPPEDVWVDYKHVFTFPPSDGNDVWRIFLPMHGFEGRGPWYLWKEITEAFANIVDTRRMKVLYVDSDLRCELAPGSADYSDVPDSFWSKGLDDVLDLQQQTNEHFNLIAGIWDNTRSEESFDRLRFWQERREWPDVFYDNPADFFNDNQVIDC